MRFPLSNFVVALCLFALSSRAADQPVVTTPATPALPFLSPIFSDNMVLQRGQPNTIWGWTVPGETVRVDINGNSAEATAGSDGRWSAKIAPPANGTDCTVRVIGSQRVELHNVVVGDVWLCGGQSNMEFALAHARNGTADVAAANQPQIRLYKVASRSAYAPAAVPAGTWKVCTPQSVSEGAGFSAVAYYFARRVQAETGVPIGLIEDCLGGTPAECWMSPEAVAATGQFAEPLAEIARLRDAHAPAYGSYIMHWYDEYDVGLKPKIWSAPDLADQDWKSVRIPGAFDALGLTDVPCVVWFRKEITLPDPLPAGKAFVRLGVVEKMETTYVNGHQIGTSSWVENPRNYPVLPNVLKPGRNVIAIRIFKLKSKGSFLSPPEQLQLAFTGGPDIPLAGEWKAKVSVDARPPHPLPLGFENYPTMPTVLYQGMIHPLVPLALKGALWYQGEANQTRGHQYRVLLPALIADWRRAFGQADLTFLIASLPAFGHHRDTPGSDGWTEVREAQIRTPSIVPNAYTAITVDTGDADNIHPKDKQPVGDRLALIALAKVYGKNVPYSGPTFRSLEKLPHAFRLHFSHADGGLKVHGDKPAELSIAGADRVWHWATARLDGDTMVVSSPDVPEPVAVRYAWQANPKPTLFNAADLPAAPFRTDDWPGVTDAAPPW